MGEFDFIAWLRAELAANHAPNRTLLIPPGDDAALQPGSPQGLLFAADMLMDGVHFDLRHTAPELAGRKALAVNLSDIAAMAGTPRSVTVCLALPRRGGELLARRVLSGMLPLAQDFGVAIAGGDTNSWDGPLVISVAITGDPHPQGSCERRGAQVGDWICVTGSLGGSLAGKHLNFTPRVAEAQLLRSAYQLTAMLDLSDGLGSDLRHLLDASEVGAVLRRDDIPISAAATAGNAGVSALSRALADGEDFELCFTLPAARGAALVHEQPFGSQLQITPIGVITDKLGLVWDDGTVVRERGFVHALEAAVTPQ